MLITILFLCLFPALLASFPARNSDLWLHLAAGRRLAQGEWPPPAGAGHSWLYDLLSYGVYSTLGGPALVFAKVVLVVGLALVLLRLSRPGRGWGAAAVSTALALLATDTRLLLQPATVSYLFLALALWASFPRADREASPASSLRDWLPPWPLVALFVVWANVDGWFVLGLLTVALARLGQALDGEGGPSVASVLRPLSSVLCLAAVCLLNPAHFRAFVPPAELSWFSPPWSSAVPLALRLTYFPLLVLSLLSFLVTRPRWQWLLPWLGLALLSAFQVRTAPFFAVVAGPALARNVQDRLARRGDAPSSRSLLVSLSPCLLVCLGIGLLVCAWPGWLQAPPFEPRRWDVERSPSLEAGAAALRRWHSEGRLGPESRGLHLSAESANAFAWSVPEDRGLFDPGLAAALRGEKGAADDWADRLRAAGVDHVIAYDPDSERLLAALWRLQEWPLLYLEGGLAVFGWRGAAPETQDRFLGWELDLDQLAFRPADAKRAPHEKPERAPEPRHWWDAFWRPAPPPTAARDEARLLLLQAEARRGGPAAAYRRLAAWEAGQAAALVGAAGAWPGPAALLDADLRLVLVRPPLPEAGGAAAAPPITRAVLRCQQWFALQQDDTPPALLFLAVRAARRAVAVNPEDARAYLVLGKSYRLLLHATRERAWAARVPELVHLRRAQASAALNRAVALDPRLAEAHLGLAELYREMDYLDLALHHLRQYQRLAGAAAAPYGQAVKRLAEEVSAGEAAYAAKAGKLRVLDRALLAFEKGLRGKARDLLLESDVAAFGPEGMKLELDLLLRTGRPRDVWGWTSPEQKAALGAMPYHWVRAQAQAALGDYGRAEEECEQLAAAGRGAPTAAHVREALALWGTQASLNEQFTGALWPARAMSRVVLPGTLRRLATHLGDEANANTMRGLLLLEEGNADEAEVAFRLALALWRDADAAASGAGLDFKARPIAQGYLPRLSADDKVTR
jgi:hypothetical protein